MRKYFAAICIAATIVAESPHHSRFGVGGLGAKSVRAAQNIRIKFVVYS